MTDDLRILIIEDDDTLRLTLGAFLRRQGFEVDLAENGRNGAFGRVSALLRRPACITSPLSEGP